MSTALVIAYVGAELNGLDLVSGLDKRLERPVRVVSTQVDRVATVLEDNRIDCVVAGRSLSGGDFQRVVFEVMDTNEELPVFETGGDVAAVPSKVEIHHLDPEAGPAAQANALLTELSASTDEHMSSPGPFLYLAVDSAWKVIDWDPQLSDWTGVDTADALGMSLWTALSEWHDTEFEEACRAVMGESDDRRKQVFHEESRKWFAIHIIGHKRGGLELYLQDVTEFQNAGGKIEGTGARFEETLDRITDAFFALDTQERFVFLNSQAEFLLDVNAKDVTGVRFWDAFPAAVSTTFYEEFNMAIEAQEPTSFEEYYRPLDRWFEVNAYPSSEGLSVFLREITDQVELQEKLEQLHSVTRELVVTESDREIAVKTVEATEDILNFTLVTVWQYDESTETLDPLSWSDEMDDRVDNIEPLNRNNKFIWEVYDTGEPRNMGFVPSTATTAHPPGKMSSELLVRIGEYGVLGAYADERDAFDETDIRLFKILASTVESALGRAKRERQLARRNERLNDFASIVSHDLRNPLNVASSHVELARMTGETGDHLDKIEDSLFRMEDLIENILSRARGKTELDRKQISLADIGHNAWGTVDTTAATLKIDEDAQFSADSERIQQLFENLFRNAIEHSEQGVTVRIGLLENGFYIADDGPGIPEERRDEIFKQGVTHADGGTGYGLAIVTDIVEGHGWNVDVTESWAGGAQFDIYNIYSLSTEESQ
ncbi:ATP-binding protein [Halovenus rubra]|uniref:ATP-binding protein n=2 Tax=Halovenus rubra TaxID=869890 RepID=A0ACC7E2Q1_9EURY|nr:ATP-binding protein [Halovenus rubra]